MTKHCLLVAIFSLGLSITTFTQTRERKPLLSTGCGQEGDITPRSAKGSRYGAKTAFILSSIDAAAAEEFKKAWHATRNGSDGFEGLVLVYKGKRGSISARSQGKSEEQHRFTFGWTADIIAVVHTHANAVNPTPAEADLKVADRFLVPVFTLTRRGMYVYEPETRKISIVQNGLDWLRSSKWNPRDDAPIWK